MKEIGNPSDSKTLLARDVLLPVSCRRHVEPLFSMQKTACIASAAHALCGVFRGPALEEPNWSKGQTWPVEPIEHHGLETLCGHTSESHGRSGRSSSSRPSVSSCSGPFVT